MRTVRAGSTLAADLAVTSLSVSEIWAHYLALGGNHGIRELEEYLYRANAWSPQEHDVLAQALNDHFIELGQGHPASYSDEL